MSAAGEENLKQYIITALTAKTNKMEYPFIVFDKKQNSYAAFQTSKILANSLTFIQNIFYGINQIPIIRICRVM